MFSLKVVLAVSLLVAAVVAEDILPLGGEQKLEGDKLREAEDSLKDSLTKVAAGEGPHYKIGKIHSATYAVVSGSLYRINADLINEKTNETKKCNISIWEQNWKDDGLEVTFECEGEEKLVKSKLSTK